MFPKHIYDRLDQKPALCPINKSVVGVAQQKLSLDGVAFMTIVMRSDKGQEFSINYEPKLVSSDIKSFIFGINSENKFEEVKRSNNNSFILLETNSGEIFTLKMYRQKEFASAFVKLRRTAVINENSSGFIKAKIKGLPTRELKDKHFLLENRCEDRSEFPDIYFNDINSKNLKIPTQNNSECEQKFNCGTTLGKLTLLQTENDTRMFTEENMKFVKTSETIIKEKYDLVFELSDKNKETLKGLRNCISRIIRVWSLFCSVRSIEVCIFYRFF